MKNIISWMKSNVLTVFSAILMLGSIGVIAWAMMHGGAAADEAWI